jgi:predicted RNA-binding protein with PUA-like domain
MPIKPKSKPSGAASADRRPAGTKAAKKAPTKAAAKAAAAARPANAPQKTDAIAKPSAKRKAPAPIVSTGYWLLKSEPDAFSWEKLKAKGRAGEEWSGVRNYLARNNMRAMALGDLAFFYHSNIGLEVVGICEVSALAHPDSTADDPKWECVDVRAVRDMPKPVTLADVKANPKLASMSLVTSMRLSVQPVTAAEWAEICRMGGLDARKLAKG